jgi:hypothetical protein
VELATRVRDGLERLVDRAAMSTDEPEAFLRAVVDEQGERMARAGLALMCTLISLSLAVTEAPEAGPLAAAIADTFFALAAALARRLRSKGLEPVAAERVAANVTAGLEGAMIVSRATRNAATFSHLSEAIPALLAAASS